MVNTTKYSQNAFPDLSKRSKRFTSLTRESKIVKVETKRKHLSLEQKKLNSPIIVGTFVGVDSSQSSIVTEVLLPHAIYAFNTMH